MVVVAAVVGGGAGAGSHGGWGTWEELVLGSAVLRHGGAAWAAVADELRCRTRSPCLFSPEDCEAKFVEIQSRYSACNAWFEELRKQRITELKRELEQSENSIGSLQSVIESLSNSKHGDGNSDCHAPHTESCSLSGNRADNNSSSKELSRDRSSAASFTEEASQCQKSQPVQHCDTDSVQINTTSTEESVLKAIDEKVCAKESLLWGSRKQRGIRVRRITLKADASTRDGEPTSTSCIDRDGSSECCKEEMKKDLNLKASNVESGAMKKGLRTSNVEPDAVKKGLKTKKLEPGVIKKSLTTPSAESGFMKKGLKTSKLESDLMKNGLKTPKHKSSVMKNSLETPKVDSGVKNSLKTPKVESGVSVIEKEKANLAGILKFITSQVDSLMLQRQVDIQRKRARYKKMIRRHMDFQTLHSNIKNGAISSTKELLRDILLFVNNIMAFYPKDTLEHMAAVQLRDLACKTVSENANCVSKAASTPIAKKNAQMVQPGRHILGDVKGNKVSSRDAAASYRQGEGKGNPNDKPPAANLKTVQKSEPAKKRGVGRPPKSAPANLKGKPNASAQEDSPSRGRKRLRR